MAQVDICVRIVEDQILVGIIYPLTYITYIDRANTVELKPVRPIFVLIVKLDRVISSL